ncbi:DNA helicase [Tanacetum coccineum]
MPTTSSLQEKATVCPKNDTAYEINVKILSTIEGEITTYLSNDEAIPVGRDTCETKMLYPLKYLNTMKYPSFLPHYLQLKVASSSLAKARWYEVAEVAVNDWYEGAEVADRLTNGRVPRVHGDKKWQLSDA